MPERIAARLITGPAAFLLGGVIEVLSFAVTALRVRARTAVKALRAGGSGRFPSRSGSAAP